MVMLLDFLTLLTTAAELKKGIKWETQPHCPCHILAHEIIANPKGRIRYGVQPFKWSAYKLQSDLEEGCCSSATSHMQMRDLFLLPISIKSGNKSTSWGTGQRGCRWWDPLQDMASVSDGSISCLLSNPSCFRSQKPSSRQNWLKIKKPPSRPAE